jgi:hypothetical protein
MPLLGKFTGAVTSGWAGESLIGAVRLWIYIRFLPPLNAMFVESGRDAIRTDPGVFRNGFERLWEAVSMPASIATVTKEKLSGVQMTQTAHARLPCRYVCLVWVNRGIDIGKMARSTFFNMLPKFLANLIVQDDDPVGTDLGNGEDFVAGFDA